jgi:hypothetical protein
MSRGPGRMQRFVLAKLREHTACRAYRDDREAQWQSLKLLAWCYRQDQTVQELGRELHWGEKVAADLVEQESLRRAILQLAAAGRLETRRDALGLHCRLSVAEWQQLLSVEQSSTLREPGEAGALVEQLQKLIGGAS